MENKPLRVLVVEDNEDDVRLLIRELMQGGYEPVYEQVYTATAMVGALDRGGWGLVISDHNMPQFNALQALSILKKAEIDIPFIIVSGNISDDIAVEALKAGAHDFILKDNLTRLVPAVKRELREAEIREERRLAEKKLAQNVTDILLMQEALQKRNELYDLVMQATNDTIYDWNVVTGRISWNENLVKLFGHSIPLNESDVDWWSDRIHPDERSAILDGVNAALSSERTSWSGEYRFRTAGGAYVDVLDRGFISRDLNKHPLRWIGSMMDVTARKQIEDQLKQVQRMETVGQLAGGIAHDFNNLLSVILGYSDFVIASLKSGESLESAGGDMNEIKAAALRAASLTRQLLAFSRRQVLQPVVMDLNTSILGMEKMCRRLLGEDVSLVTDLAADAGRIKADPGQIEQVLMNLVINARDAMAQGGQLTIGTKNVKLNPATFPSILFGVQPGPYVMLYVMDTGCGMTKEVKDRIFEPFFTTKEKGRGTGLGLSTVFGVVKQSGGYILVESEPNQGTTFKIYLPQVEEDVSIILPEDRFESPSPGSETILVVEDDQKIRAMIKRVLESKSYRVMDASNGEEAIRISEQFKDAIHLIITDIVMPGLNGFELVERLHESRPTTEVLYISGYTDHAIYSREVPALKTNFLMKPFTSELLINKTCELLDKLKGRT